MEAQEKKEDEQPRDITVVLEKGERARSQMRLLFVEANADGDYVNGDALDIALDTLPRGPTTANQLVVDRPYCPGGFDTRLQTRLVNAADD